MHLEGAPIIPTSGAIVYALCLGIFIPTVSAIVPVKKALNQNIVNTISSN
jgi:hypothetical protein